MYLSRVLSFLSITAAFTALAANSCGCNANTPLPPGAVAGQSVSLALPGSGGRTYILHLPSSYKPTTPHPLYFSFHGAGQTAADEEELSQFSARTFDAHGIAVYPQGQHNLWLGNPAINGSCRPNDLDFTAQLLDYLETNLCVDTSRVFAAGKSNGGGFAHALACNSTVGPRFAAFASVSGAYYYSESWPGIGRCDPGNRPAGTPFLEFHGLIDPIAPIDGGDNRTCPRTHACDPTSTARDGTFAAYCPKRPTLDIVQGWAARNGCGGGGGGGAAPPPATSNVTSSFSDLVKIASWSCPGKNASIVQHYRETDIGHCWPSTALNDDSEHCNTLHCRGNCSAQATYVFNATNVISTWFKRWTLPGTTAPVCRGASLEL